MGSYKVHAITKTEWSVSYKTKVKHAFQHRNKDIIVHVYKFTDFINRHEHTKLYTATGNNVL